MQAAAPRESLPGAVASLFEEFAAVSGATAAPGGAGPQIRTSEEWAALLSAVTSAGLLPQPELLKASQDLALPASLSSLQTRLNGAYEPPRAPAIDGLLDGAVARVRHLHGLLAQWELSALSAEQTARMVLMIEALRGRLSASIAQLRMWHDGIHAALGPERCQSLFWDLVDPITSQQDSAHAFQREMLGPIEKRCAQVRVRTAQLPGDGDLPGKGGRGAVSLAAAEAAGIDVSVGSAAGGPGGKRVRVIRCPHAGVGWSETTRLLAWMDATRQLSLSRHAPAYLGHEPCVGAGAYPAHARWHMELVGGATLADGLLEGGGLAETSLLFRHWRRELIEGLLHLSTHTTFLLPHSVTLAHAFAADDGCRIVFDHLAWGAEFPEPAEASPPAALQQALATPANVAAASGHVASGATDITDPLATGAPTRAAPPVGPVSHQALRDTLLLYDGVAMLQALLTGKPQETRSGRQARPVSGGPADGTRSAYLRAILDACCHATSPPTLRQLLSHPYFAPVDGFDREDVRAAYKRWRRQGPVVNFAGTGAGAP